MKAYHIIQWATEHETAESRKWKLLKWTPMPNKHEGLGYRQITRSKYRDSLYAGWKLICEVSSKNPGRDRGWLIRDGRPMTADDLALVTGFTKKTFEMALDFFCQSEIGWLELADYVVEPELNLSRPGATPGQPEESSSRPGATPAQPLPDKIRLDKIRLDQYEKEKNGGFASREEARKAQAQQFGATQGRLKELEAIAEDDRTPATDEELKKMRGLIRKIQKKQAGGDFTPVMATAEGTPLTTGTPKT